MRIFIYVPLYIRCLAHNVGYLEVLVYVYVRVCVCIFVCMFVYMYVFV